jgi:hypothetical protein
MAMVTIITWRKKLLRILGVLLAALAIGCFLFFCLKPQAQEPIQKTQGVESENLQEEVLRQPIRVQAPYPLER